MAPQTTTPNPWLRCFALGTAVFALSVGGEFSFNEEPFGLRPSTTSASAPLIARALEAFTPDLPLTQVGRWIGKAVLEKSRADQCG